MGSEQGSGLHSEPALAMYFLIKNSSKLNDNNCQTCTLFRDVMDFDRLCRKTLVRDNSELSLF